MGKAQIIFEEYAKIEIRVGKIVAAEVPEGSEKLIKFTVEFGPREDSENEVRTIFSGIKEWYSAEELVGVKTMWVTNIPARKNPFGESQGMLFACDDENGKPYVVRLADEVPVGGVFH